MKRILKKINNFFTNKSNVEEDDIEWVVNDMAELGVKIGGRFFWLYKGWSIEYSDKNHEDDNTPIQYRKVGKREFGECCHPSHLNRIPERYTEGNDWKNI